MIYLSFECSFYMAIFFFFSSYSDRLDLHSFPTRRSSDLVAISDFIRREYEQRGIDPRRLVTIYNGVDTDVAATDPLDRKSTRLNSSHSQISYAVFCLKKKSIRVKNTHEHHRQTDKCTVNQ